MGTAVIAAMRIVGSSHQSSTFPYTMTYVKTHQRNAEQGSIAKLTEINGETLVLEAMVWHGYENNQDTYQQHPHHIVIHILPFIFISQPGSQRCSQLSLIS